MDEMDLKDLFEYFVKKTPIIITITLLILLMGVIYTLFLKTPLYKGDTTLILVQDSSDSTSVTQSDIMLNQNLVTTYSEIIKSRRVLSQVINNLNISYSVSDLSDEITVSSINDTEIIKISVSDPDAKNARVIADTIASVFEKEIVEIYNLKNVSIIDKAEIAVEPYNINVFKDVIIYFIIGFVLAMGIVFVIYYFDTSIKSSDEIENKLKVTVLGSVPLYKEKSRKGVRL